MIYPWIPDPAISTPAGASHKKLYKHPHAGLKGFPETYTKKKKKNQVNYPPSRDFSPVSLLPTRGNDFLRT